MYKAQRYLLFQNVLHDLTLPETCLERINFSASLTIACYLESLWNFKSTNSPGIVNIGTEISLLSACLTFFTILRYLIMEKQVTDQVVALNSGIWGSVLSIPRAPFYDDRVWAFILCRSVFLFFLLYLFILKNLRFTGKLQIQ